MKSRFLSLIVIVVASLFSVPGQAKNLEDLSVLYVGAERTQDFLPFLRRNLSKVDTAARSSFKPADAAPYDVVLLDWPQGVETREMRKLRSPLGERTNWTKPTVLLGSAGLNLAVAWQVKGGSGCTCMDPLAYDLRQHEIFERPLKVDRTKAVRIPTPRDFRDEIKAPEIEVLPLVRSIDKKLAAGWCSYAYDFALHPDIELFCGGVNAKTPTAVGFWRQGNLLHFGFEQSPVDLNENGQKLLLNAIAYISRFSQDRPIARTRSVFAGPVAYSRSGPLRSARNPHYPLSFVEEAFTPSLWKELAPQGRGKIIQWLETNSQFLHPGTDLKLEMDPDLVNWGISFDSPKFFPTAFEALTKDGEGAERARRLLERYVPSGPKDGAAESWRGWYQENGRFLFASPESNDYCWYVDPLAKRRNQPTQELRGPLREDPK